MKKYPIGIQDFKKLREMGFLYVDKTEQLHKLVTYGNYYFLSRPRRFGKSLLLSTIKYLFQGEKAIFEGLWIADKHDWEEIFPVVHISFSAIGYKTLGLAEALSATVVSIAASFGIQLKQKAYDQQFAELLASLTKTKGKVVLLIDEYDKPLVDYIDRLDHAEVNRDILKSFFSIIKDADPHLRFLLITGVSKFSKVSLFSDLNHLEDITLESIAKGLTGYTPAELEFYFKDEMDSLAVKEGVSKTEIRQKIKLWYNGYQWDIPEQLYNPFSILNLVKKQHFGNYWWETGTPTFLIKLLRDEFHFNIKDIEAGEGIFHSYTLSNMNWKALMFQTGYLTIKEYEKDYDLYILGYPNHEVTKSMAQYLFEAFAEKDRGDSQALFAHLKRAVEKNDLSRFVEVVNNLFASIPYQLFIADKERFFHAILHLSFSGVGLIAESEVSTSKARVDTVIHTKTHIYVIEFKLDESVSSALSQIREKRYGSPFLGHGKEVVAVGITFSSETKEVADWQAMNYETLLVEG